MSFTVITKRFVGLFVLLTMAFGVNLSFAQAQLINAAKSNLLVVDATFEKANELNDLLEKVSDFSAKRPDSVGAYPPIVVMLHGPEIQYFEKASYSQNEKMVNLAAKLDALGVIDMRICQTASTYFKFDSTTFPSFIQVVPSASQALDQLKSDGYTAF